MSFVFDHLVNYKVESVLSIPPVVHKMNCKKMQMQLNSKIDNEPPKKTKLNSKFEPTQTITLPSQKIQNATFPQINSPDLFDALRPLSPKGDNTMDYSPILLLRLFGLLSHLLNLFYEKFTIQKRFPHQHSRPSHLLSFSEQEQTKFYDLRRGITEDFQRVAKFQGNLSKSTKKIHRF